MHLDGSPGLIPSVADVLQRTVHAFRLACDAQFPSMPDKLVSEQDPLVARNHLHQVLLDLRRIRILSKFETARNPSHVRVHDDAISLVKPTSQYDIRRLARHSGQSEQLFHVVWNATAKLVDDLLCRTHKRLGLIAKESSRTDVGFKLSRRKRCEILDRRILAKQFGRHPIDIHIRRLRRQNRRHHQLPRAFMGQSASNVRIKLVEPLEDLRNPLRCQRIVTLQAAVSRRFALSPCGDGSLTRLGGDSFLRRATNTFVTPCFCRLPSNYAAYHKLTVIRVKLNQNVSRIKSSMERRASPSTQH